jgi:hypothetical protein
MINDYAQMLSQANALRATLEEKLANARESVRKKDERIAELEKEREELKSLLKKNLSTFINKKEEGILLGIPMFEAYQLEQQALACDWIYTKLPNYSSENLSVITARRLELVTQANALKDQK